MTRTALLVLFFLGAFSGGVRCQQSSTDIELFKCDFEMDTCNLLMETSSSDFKWIRHQGLTPSFFTGPLYDHTKLTEEGYYMYAEATDHYPGEETALHLPPLNTLQAAESDLCLTLWYHMEGMHIGTFNVTQEPTLGEAPNVLYSLHRNQSSDWLQLNVTVSTSGGRVRLLAVRGGNDMGQPYGDIAIDDIILYDGMCGEPIETTTVLETTTVEPTTTTTEMASTTTTLLTTTTTEMESTSTTQPTTTSTEPISTASTTVMPTTTTEQTTTTTTSIPLTSTGKEVEITTAVLPMTSTEDNNQEVTTEDSLLTSVVEEISTSSPALSTSTSETVVTSTAQTTEETTVSSTTPTTTSKRPTTPVLMSTTKPTSELTTASSGSISPSTTIITGTHTTRSSTPSNIISGSTRSESSSISSTIESSAVSRDQDSTRIWGLLPEHFMIIIGFLAAFILILILVIIVLACSLGMTRRKYQVARYHNNYGSSVESVDAMSNHSRGRDTAKLSNVSAHY